VTTRLRLALLYGPATTGAEGDTQAEQQADAQQADAQQGAPVRAAQLPPALSGLASEPVPDSGPAAEPDGAEVRQAVDAPGA
jgi:hypothetical protein